MTSWSNTAKVYDVYLQWLEYSLLTKVQGTTLLRHNCTDQITDKLTIVTLKQIVDRPNAQPFDFYQVNYFTCRLNDAMY